MSDQSDRPNRPSIMRRLMIGASQKPIYLVLVGLLVVLSVGFLIAGILFVSSF